MAITVVYVPGPIDLAAGLRRLETVGDGELAAAAPVGILGWGWRLPGEVAPPVPWADDAELAALTWVGSEVPAGLVGTFAAAARVSVARCLERAARLLRGEDPTFERRVATRVPVANGGELVIAVEDQARGAADCAYCDVVRLPIEILPDLGRAMRIHGIEALALTAAVRAPG